MCEETDAYPKALAELKYKVGDKIRVYNFPDYGTVIRLVDNLPRYEVRFENGIHTIHEGQIVGKYAPSPTPIPAIVNPIVAIVARTEVVYATISDDQLVRLLKDNDAIPTDAKEIEIQIKLPGESNKHKKFTNVDKNNPLLVSYTVFKKQ